MVEGIFLALVFLGFLGLIGFLRWRETRYLKKSTKEAMSKRLRTEIEREVQDAERRKKKFADQLKKFDL
jgi:hypothetical protein